MLTTIAYIVQGPSFEYGIWYIKDRFTDGMCPVYVLNKKGIEPKKPKLFNPSYLTIIAFLEP